MKKCESTRARGAWRPTAPAVAALLCASGLAQAAPINAGPDWDVHWDNTVLYNLGLRAQDIDPKLGSDPAHAESEYKFSKKGDVVTNRVSLLSEFDAVYQRRMGFRISASYWKDFAYDDQAKTNPGAIAVSPAGPVPYGSNYDNATYSGRTKHDYIQGGQFLDAFVFTKFDIANRPATLRLGRLTQFWGNALFFGNLGINYSQSASDVIKASQAPGTQAKELAIPRGQINLMAQVSDDWSLGAQYFFEYRQNRLPEGGTFFGPVDFLFEGPSKFGAVGVRRAPTDKPKDINGNFGIQARWNPQWLDGTLGFYARRFDETQPGNPIFGADAAGVPFYRISDPRGTQLYGVSLDKQIGGMSTGLEVSYRRNTGLNTNGSVVDLSDLQTANKNARGDTLNVVFNALKILERSSLYDTGQALFEIGYVHKIKLTEAPDRYKGVGTAACDAAAQQVGIQVGTKMMGCSTTNAVVIAGALEPQWLQVGPSLDLSVPMFAMYGLYGSAASNGVPVKQGDLSYSLGLKLNYRQTYSLQLQFNGNHGSHTGETNAGAAAGVPNGTPGFPTWYATGNNVYMFNDRNWWSLTFNTSF